MFFNKISYNTKYNLNNLLLIKKNINNIKSNIYKQKNIDNLIIKKQKLIKEYIKLNDKNEFNKKLLFRVKNIYYYQTLSKIFKNTKEIEQIEVKIKKIEWEEHLIIKTFKIKKYTYYLHKILF